MLRRALVMLRRALVMLRRAPPLETRMDKGFAGIEPPFTFLLPFFYQQRPVDNRVSEAKPEAKQPYLAPPRGENSPHLTHRPHCYAVGERATAARQPNSQSGNIDQDA